MTIQQLQYVLEISKTGSVSKAARNLFLSQPNISSAIKNLEHELGITIFERTPMGMQLTSAGQKLVQRASSIMKDIEEITSGIGKEEECSFRLIYPRYVPAFEAFWDVCRNHQEENHLRFSCFIGNGDKSIEDLYQDMCDLVVYIDFGNASLPRLCSDLHIRYVPLKEVKFYVQLSEHHPLLQESGVDLNQLKNYPYVAFADPNDRSDSWLPWEEIVNPDKLICVQSTSSRVALVANSHAYSIVLPHSEEYNRKNHVVAVPFHSHSMTLGYLYSLDRGLTPLSLEYLEYFKQKIEF